MKKLFALVFAMSLLSMSALAQDRDGDGIPDSLDHCPDLAGIERYQGCPIPDSDGDGINDENDKCPYLPGVKANQGCPILKDIRADERNIFFISNSYKLSVQSFNSLNNIAEILRNDENLKLDIEGFADSSGKNETNQELSESRAKAVQDYLVNQCGIDETRIKAIGYGSARPIADNRTEKGRARNRRIELHLKYY
ncbi:MAG: OmpA family protein [Chitinophagales bacterium]